MLRKLLLIFLGFILLWQIVITLSHPPSYLLPTPMETFIAFKRFHALLMKQFFVTTLETLLGFILGTLFGMTAAIALILSKHLRNWCLPLLLISQAIPTFAIAPLLVLWFGFGMLSKIIIIILMIFFPITSSFYDGLKNTPQHLMDYARVSELGKIRKLLKIQLPSSLPKLASGLRIAAVIAPVGAIIGEWVGSSAGLGYLMLTANARMETPMVFACLFLLIIMTISLYFIVDKLLSRLLFWEST
jgi:putative hydroxymethylpyrimidine transport system permease protein